MDGKAVRRVRKRLGLSQRGFGELLGIHSLSVSRIELESKGASEPTVRLIVLLDRLGVPAFRRMLGNRGRRRDANKADRERAVQARPRKVGGRLRGPGEPASAPAAVRQRAGGG